MIWRREGERKKREKEGEQQAKRRSEGKYTI
jgi:hypothetical protein